MILFLVFFGGGGGGRRNVQMIICVDGIMWFCVVHVWFTQR